MSQKDEDELIAWKVIGIIVLGFLIPFFTIPIAILSLIVSLLNKKNFIKVFYKIYSIVFIMFIIAFGGCLLLFWGIAQ